MGDNLDQPTNPVPMKVFQGGGGAAPESLLPLPAQPTQMMEFKGGGKTNVKPFRGIDIENIPKELREYFVVLSFVDSETKLDTTSETEGVYTVPVMMKGNQLIFFPQTTKKSLENLYIFSPKGGEITQTELRILIGDGKSPVLLAVSPYFQVKNKLFTSVEDVGNNNSEKSTSGYTEATSSENSKSTSSENTPSVLGTSEATSSENTQSVSENTQSVSENTQSVSENTQSVSENSQASSSENSQATSLETKPPSETQQIFVPQTIPLASGHIVRYVTDELKLEIQTLDFTPDEKEVFERIFKVGLPFVKKFVKEDANKEAFFQFWKTFINYDGTQVLSYMTNKQMKEVQSFYRKVIDAYRKHLFETSLQYLLMKDPLLSNPEQKEQEVKIEEEEENEEQDEEEDEEQKEEQKEEQEQEENKEEEVHENNSYRNSIFQTFDKIFKNNEILKKKDNELISFLLETIKKDKEALLYSKLAGQNKEAFSFTNASKRKEKSHQVFKGEFEQLFEAYQKKGTRGIYERGDVNASEWKVIDFFIELLYLLFSLNPKDLGENDINNWQTIFTKIAQGNQTTYKTSMSILDAKLKATHQTFEGGSKRFRKTRKVNANVVKNPSRKSRKDRSKQTD